jgi:CMP-N-acetylneuraminic acid synthetase
MKGVFQFLSYTQKLKNTPIFLAALAALLHYKDVQSAIDHYSNSQNNPIHYVIFRLS